MTRGERTIRSIKQYMSIWKYSTMQHNKIKFLSISRFRTVELGSGGFQILWFGQIKTRREKPNHIYL